MLKCVVAGLVHLIPRAGSNLRDSKVENLESPKAVANSVAGFKFFASDISSESFCARNSRKRELFSIYNV